MDPAAPLAKLSELPMMTARRLSSGSKLAVECGLAMLRRYQPDAVLYTSRHGELERNYRIVHALATEQALSPTD
ncbi:beta-ketoacyl synthase, partial [Escherichia coli]